MLLTYFYFTLLRVVIILTKFTAALELEARLRNGERLTGSSHSFYKTGKSFIGFNCIEGTIKIV